MNILINYADSKYRSAQKWNVFSARLFNVFDKIYEFGPQDIEPVFYENHIKIFSIERGNGCWLWKSYFINQVLQNANDGDKIFYIDSGTVFIRNPKLLFDYIDDTNPIFVTDIPLIESCWTKPECFDIMDARAYMNENQIQSGYILFIVNDYTRNFFQKYFGYSKDTDMLIPAGLGARDEVKEDYGCRFVSHREDQSILSLLCHKEGIKAHREISQRGVDPYIYYNSHYAFRIPEHPEDKYPTIVYLHKSPSLTKFIASKIYKFLRLRYVKRLFVKK